MRHKLKIFSKLFSDDSIGHKYSRGYFLILASAIIVFVFSLVNTQLLTSRYRETMNELLEVNEVFVAVEDIHATFQNYYPFIRHPSIEPIEEKIAAAQDTLAKLVRRQDDHYSREEMDLCFTVETYLEQTQHLSQIILQYIQSNNTDGFDASDNQSFSLLHTKAQDTLTYIKQNFRDIYSSKLIEAQVVQQDLETLRTITVCGQVITMLAALWTTVVFYRRVVEGVAESVSALTRFSLQVKETSQFHERIQLQTGDEMEIFADTFNDMLDTIERQIADIEADSKVREQLQASEMENLRISSALQRSELKFLQSRINPHFLFNTLNMIMKTAIMENAASTASLIETTAELLRYSLHKLSSSVTLRDELHNVQNYIAIQESRFGERISFAFEVEEGCMDQRMPCMIVQPLVENAVTHGVGSLVEGGRVVIRAFEREGRYCFEVEDNGAGIEPERLASIKTMYAGMDDNDPHIGLKNVYQRLMIYFRDDLRFDIESRKGKTLIHVEMPEQVRGGRF